jgi:uncharacterized membrane protein YcaP (DUF421 family)
MSGILGIVALQSACVYLYLVVLIRLFGRRQLSQLTPFDFLVTILLGSCVETALIHANTGLLAGLASATTLLLFNRLLTILTKRSRWFRHWILAGPMLVVHNGRIQTDALHKLGLTEGDLMEGLRGREEDDLSRIHFAVVEADGTINVVRKR